MIVENENFLTSEECKTAIQIHSKYFPTHGHCHLGTDVFRASNMLLDSKNYIGETFPESFFIRKLFAIISYHIQQIDREAFINYFGIVRWPTNSYQGVHEDFDIHPFTSIIYLNDDYEGGNTFVEDKLVTPKAGKIITFNGSKLSHGVIEIKSGIRYTIPVWYTFSPNLIDKFIQLKTR